jgi:hypothetical protein
MGRGRRSGSSLALALPSQPQGARPPPMPVDAAPQSTRYCYCGATEIDLPSDVAAQAGSRSVRLDGALATRRARVRYEGAGEYVRRLVDTADGAVLPVEGAVFHGPVSPRGDCVIPGVRQPARFDDSASNGDDTSGCIVPRPGGAGIPGSAPGAA